MPPPRLDQVGNGEVFSAEMGFVYGQDSFAERKDRRAEKGCSVFVLQSFNNSSTHFRLDSRDLRMDSLGWAIPKSVNLVAGMPYSTTFINSSMLQSYCGWPYFSRRFYMPRPAQTSPDHNIGNGQILGLSGKSDNPSSTQILPAHVGTCQLRPVRVFTGPERLPGRKSDSRLGVYQTFVSSLYTFVSQRTFGFWS
ncbi:hypothetical protein BDP27DRAFT_1361443 [Rhodocollybia butyracea]|uniref:Uncharacterized protein n=1 Tax=Rhodocollybia butyracea TaxID=206335 RepID=A0A9P5Q1S3_9AGAR|nr:hypothetical protein BDP27DRAFT_1361443 [Rhodocollybia butyracea]